MSLALHSWNKGISTFSRYFDQVFVSLSYAADGQRPQRQQAAGWGTPSECFSLG